MSKNLLNKIQLLETENRSLKAENSKLKHNLTINESRHTVSVPKNIQPVFNKAEKTVGNYFRSLKIRPGKGTIDINGERYVLVRASALSYEFFNTITNLYKNRGAEEAFSISKNFLFDIGHVLGIEDARKFHKKMALKNPLEKLSAGPVHFAYTGWASVEILPESNPVPNENFFIKYNHPYSFEADSWIKKKVKSSKPVCTMNAAYSSGWCQESFGIPLTAVEITCRAKGDKHCTFIMAQPDKINGFLDKEVSINKLKKKPEVPFFFERKKIEEQLIKNQQILSTAQKIAKIGSFEFNLTDNSLTWSDELYNIFQLKKTQTKSSELYAAYLSRIPEFYQKVYFKHVNTAVTKGINYTFKHPINLPNGVTKWLYCSGIPIKNEKNKVVQIIGIAQDISDSVLQQEKLKNNLHEKETLLKEIHHRVKNNLQIISSLLNLQAETIKDKEAKEKYRESLGRVKSMALIHELLYQTKNLANLKVNEYLNELVKFISETYNFNQKIKVALVVDPKIKRIDMNKAIPCGLIINESVSNAFKYAFQNKKAGKITVSLKVLNKDPYKFCLTIEDNGIGILNKHIDLNNPKTLGLQLIKSLSDQLDGKLDVDSKKGTRIAVSFN